MPVRHVNPAAARAAPNPKRAAERLLAIVDKAKNAQPTNVIYRDDGRVLVNQALSAIAGIADALPMGLEIASLMDGDGRIYLDPPGQDAGAPIRLDAAIAQSSRTLAAGANLIVIDPAATGIPTRGAPLVGYQNGHFATFEPVTFSVVDFDADPEAEVPLSESPVQVVEIDPADMVSRAFSFRLSRRDLKSAPNEQLAGEILWPIAQGLGRVIDAAVFSELAAQAANPWAIGKAAEVGVPFAALAAMVGTNGTGAQTVEGGLYVDGVPAELTADMAETRVGVWSRTAVAINPEVNLLVKRTDVSGAVEFTCWIDAKAYVPNPAMFWDVA